MDLNLIWFLLIVILLTGYAVLDGFDFGVGILHLFTKDTHERRININAIGPIWDGNEVWLLTGGGALFAAFPIVYATVFSGFYLALMLLLVALIFRAVSIEFRGKVDNQKWVNVWDWAFGIGSLLPAILLGVAFGNILRGIPLDQNKLFTGSFLGLLNPYSILIGVLTTVLFTMHGAIYLSLKTDGVQRDRAVKYARLCFGAFIILYAVSTVSTVFAAPYLFEGITQKPLFWIFTLILLGSLLYLPVTLKKKKFSMSIVLSSLVIASILALASISLFPRLVPSITDLNNSLTIYNASSSSLTLSTMLIIALIGMPLVIIYTFFIYRVFKGKVVISKDSY